MIIRIASTRTPKVNGVKKAVEKVVRHFHFDHSTISFETLQAASGVSDTPTSIDELMTGARQRAQSVFPKDVSETVLTVGVEGGLFHIGADVFLQSWTCVYDGTDVYYGSSGAIEIPTALARSVLEEGSDLGDVIDIFAKQQDVRSSNGTFGVLSNDLVTREESFETATVMALVPYFNKAVFGRNLKKT